MRRTLVVMAKAPIPGKVNTGLCPPLDAGVAARLYECFVLDILEKASSAPDAELVISYTPAQARTFFQGIAPQARLMLQRARRPEERISDCFKRLCEPGRSVVVLGIDSPTLPAMCLELAFDALSSGRVDVVFGPSDNGGYYLVGANEYHPHLLTPNGDRSQLMEKTIERAAESHLDWYLLPEWHEIDHPADLAYLRGELLERSTNGPSARHTRGLLRELVDSGAL